MRRRDYTADGLVRLPRLGADEAIALGTMLVTRVRAAPLPDLMQRPSATLEKTLAELLAAAARRPPPRNRVGSAEADRRLDAAWSGLRDVVAGFAKLPAPFPKGEQARALQKILFSEGLRFTRLDHRGQWSESRVRLRWLDEEPAATLVRELGAEPFALEVREAQEAYGAALGITEVLPRAPEPEERQEVRRRLRLFLKVLRSFVVHLAVVAESERPEEAQAAAKLLALVSDWSPSGR